MSTPWLTKISRYAADGRRFPGTISRQYWADMQAAAGRTLAHVLPLKLLKYVPPRFRHLVKPWLNGGWNYVLLPRLFKSKLGGFNQLSGMSPSPLARAAEVGFATTILGTRAAAGYGLLRYIQDLHDKNAKK